MRLALRPAPWVVSTLGRELSGGAQLLDGVWSDAAVEFYAVRAARIASGQQAPKGVQPFLNAALDHRFDVAGWEGAGGRYRLNDAWLRITFRHSMSLGSDFLDALRLVRKEGVRQVAIVAGTSEFLKLVTPNDAGALVSYERLWAQASELDGVLDFDLFIGGLSAASRLPPEVSSAIVRDRPRDLYRPTS